MSFNPAEHLILSHGAISVRNVMLAAHAKAKRDMAQGKLSRFYDAEYAKYWTYARYFKEAIQWAWDRAHQDQRKAGFGPTVKMVSVPAHIVAHMETDWRIAR